MANKFRLARMRKGLTQKEAALLLNVSTAYLCKVEKLKITPSDELLYKMRKQYEDYSLEK